MKRFIFNRWFLFALRVILGAIFTYAGITKIQEPLNFADSIATFQMLPSQLINIFALALPPFEIIVGLMLITGWKVRLATFATLALSVIFAIALGQALVRGLEVDCGCFGSGEPSVLKTWASLGRDILLIAASLLLYGVYSRRGREDAA
ncbi:MAG: DoxX family membrane protein [Chthoniobacterales bacterium]|nr:DoxX family membrane protein [Chthoniobacterales bacterium]